MKGKSRLKGDSALNVASEKLPKGYLSGPQSNLMSMLPERDDLSPSVELDRGSPLSQLTGTPSARQQQQKKESVPLETVQEKPKQEWKYQQKKEIVPKESSKEKPKKIEQQPQKQ